MTSKDGPSIMTGVLATAGWGAIARSHHGRRDIMFGPVITTEAQLAFAGARVHSNNTAEMTAMVEALSFLGLHGLVARAANPCVFFYSKHAAGVFLGTNLARTHVQPAYGHSGNLGNECADHAAALGSLGLVSNHNLATRWVRHNFCTCFVLC